MNVEEEHRYKKDGDVGRGKVRIPQDMKDSLLRKHLPLFFSDCHDFLRDERFSVFWILYTENPRKP